MTATITPPSSLEALYRERRDQGADHREAANAAMHAYGGGRRPRDLAYRVDRARAAWERDHGEPQPEPEAEPSPEPDAFAKREGEITGRIAQLESTRASLSLDALTDEDKAGELADVEARLAGARAELERLHLARREAARREQSQQEDAERQAREKSLRIAAGIQAEREAAARKVDETAAAFAAALAEHAGLAGQQAQALLAAGQIRELREALPPEWALECAFAHALQQAGAPGGWVQLTFQANSRAAPLAQTDPRRIDPA